MARYAEKTTVPVEKSQGEILGLVIKRGAKDYMSGSKDGRPFLCFTLKGAPIQIVSPPIPNNARDPDQERRRQWRVMLIWVKGQLEAVDAGLMNTATAFMSQLVMKDGRTVGETAEQDGFEKMIGSGLALPAPTKE